jgi:hypothetical protein
MTQSNLTLKSKEFRRFLNSLSKISDTSILEVKSDEVYSIASSEDRSMFLWSSLEGDFDVETVLNLPSLTKLSNLLDMIGTDEIEFELKRNKLQYRGTSVKFDYHLYDDGILTKPKITLAKIKGLAYDYTFEVEKSFIKTLMKNSSFFKDTNKLYIYTEDDHLVWSLADRTMSNTDTLTVIGEEVDFEMDEFILNLDNIRLIDFGDSSMMTVNINNNGIGKIQINSNELTLNYIVSSLTK